MGRRFKGIAGPTAPGLLCKARSFVLVCVCRFKRGYKNVISKGVELNQEVRQAEDGRPLPRVRVSHTS